MSVAELIAPDLVMTEGTEGTFLLPALDNAISRQIVETGAWAAHDVALFRKLVRAGQTVLDIGANVGHHSVVFSKLVGPEGSVLAFEPQQIIFNFLCANLALNGCRNVRPFQVAVGDGVGFIPMCGADYSKEGNWGALPISKRPEFQVGERVPLTMIDTVIEDWPRPVHFMKIDVQTFELFVLRGAEKTIRRDCPTIFVEISPYWMQHVNS